MVLKIKFNTSNRVPSKEFTDFSSLSWFLFDSPFPFSWDCFILSQIVIFVCVQPIFYLRISNLIRDGVKNLMVLNKKIKFNTSNRVPSKEFTDFSSLSWFLFDSPFPCSCDCFIVSQIVVFVCVQSIFYLRISNLIRDGVKNLMVLTKKIKFNTSNRVPSKEFTDFSFLFWFVFERPFSNQWECFFASQAVVYVCVREIIYLIISNLIRDDPDWLSRISRTVLFRDLLLCILVILRLGIPWFLGPECEVAPQNPVLSSDFAFLFYCGILFNAFAFLLFSSIIFGFLSSHINWVWALRFLSIFYCFRCLGSAFYVCFLAGWAPFFEAFDMVAASYSTVVFVLLSFVIIVIPLLISVAYFTLAERKMMGRMHRRRGPNVVGFSGLLQPLADGLKLFVKESIIPSNSNYILFILSPMVTFILSLVGWGVVPFGFGRVLSDVSLGLLYLFMVSSLGVYGVICAGWSSNSKYAFLGALRSAAQMISYEISIGLVVVSLILLTGTLNLSFIVLSQESVWFLFPLFPSFFLFAVSALAETNRHPFDLPEAESELVSGYNVDYSGMGFALFFLGEYANMLLMCALVTILFLGGWYAPFLISYFVFDTSFFFSLKILSGIFFFVWTRSSLPRYRYDQLMYLGWKVLLPLAFSWVTFVSGIVYSFSVFPF
jgi:NADH-quinone oxidoreductase subunit H